MDIAAWLRGLGLGEYEQAFRDNAIDAEVLPELTGDDLKEIGVVAVGHRRKLLAAIAALRTGSAAPDPAVTPLLPEAERRQVTVLFADLCGYTALSRDLDAEEVHALLEGFFGLVDGIVERYGGSVDKHIGDCVMAVFGAPIAHGNDPERAVRAALEIQRRMPGLGQELGRAIAVHVGVASGRVVASGTGGAGHRSYTVTGDSVNLASRLTDQAAPGEILISDAVHLALPERFVREAAGSLAVKGLVEPVPAWRLLEGATIPLSSPRPLVGRRGEIRQLEGVLTACRETGHGQAVHIRGEAGIGKTRLVEEVCRIATARGVAVHVGLVLDFGAGAGQDAIRALVRSLLGLELGGDVAATRMAAERALAEALVPSDHRVYLNDLLDLQQSAELRALYEAMDNERRNAGRLETAAALAQRIAARGPILLVVEDVHWADPLTLAHLAALTRAAAARPIVLVMTSRVEGDPLDGSWRVRTGGAALTTIDLGPLRPEEAEALAGTYRDPRAVFVRRCVDRAGGNPLFLEHLLRHPEEGADAGVPGSIQGLVQARLDRLDPSDKHALQAASVLGQRFAPDALRHLADDVSYDGARLLAHLLVRPAGDGFLFAHALVRDAVYDSLLKAKRRALHRRAADWFAGRDPVLRAEHLERAEDPRAAGAFLEAAHAEAAQHHQERAAALAARGLALVCEPGLKHALACLRGDLLRNLGAIEGSLEAFERALSEARDDAERCRAWIGLAASLRIVDRYDEAFEALVRAQAAAEAASLIRELAGIHSLRGNLCFPLGRLEECLSQHEQARRYALEVGSAEAEARALSGLADAFFAGGRMRMAFDAFDRCIELCRAHGFVRIEVANLIMRGITHLYRNELALGLEDCRAALGGAQEIGDRRSEVNAYATICYLLWEAGDIAATKQSCETGLELVRRLGARRFETFMLMHLGLVLAHEGQLAAAEQLARDAVGVSRATRGAFLGPWALAVLAYVCQDPQTRRSSLAEGEVLLQQECLGHNHLWFYRYAMEAALARGDWDEAERYATALEQYTRPEPLPWADYFVARGRALAASGRGGDRCGAALAAELERLRVEAERVGLGIARTAIERALTEGPGAHRSALFASHRL